MIHQVFTGLVQASAPVVAVVDSSTLRKITIAMDPTAGDQPGIRPGDSIAINGVCLTAVTVTPQSVSFDVVPQTCALTNLAALVPGDVVHVERALRIGDRLDGHFVQGHIDGVATLLALTESHDDCRLRIAVPKPLARYLTPQGSITIDGVSLTIAALTDDYFEVALIPTTRQITHLTRHAPGYAFNIECDMIAKNVIRFMQLHQGAQAL